jgi:hypothetical protein
MNKEINNKSLLFDLGLLPISNRFLKNEFEKSPKFPFKVDISERNGLISLNKSRESLWWSLILTTSLNSLSKPKSSRARQ